MPDRLVVRQYEPADRTAVLLVLEAVARVNPGYPFRIARERDALDAWLHEAGDVTRYVAVRDGSVVGHVQVAPPSQYIRTVCAELGVNADGLVEVGRLFSDPYVVRAGIGRALLRHVSDDARAQGRDLVLLVPEHQGAAVAMYEGEGWETIAAPAIEVRGESVQVRIMRAPVVALEPPGRSL